MMWGEVMEDKGAESVLLAITRLACSFGAPVQIQVDPNAAEVEVGLLGLEADRDLLDVTPDLGVSGELPLQLHALGVNVEEHSLQ